MSRPRTTTIGVAILAALYAFALLADLIGPYAYTKQVRIEPLAPISSIHFFDEAGNFHLRPFIYGIKLTEPQTFGYEEVKTEQFPIGFFAKGAEYRILGLFATDRHLFGVQGMDTRTIPHVRLLGADQLGRDKFSRLLRAMRFSLIVTPLGALIALMIGVVVGAVSGYAGRTLDNVLMGVTDTLIALPALVLILAARAAFPLELSLVGAGALLVFIFGFTGWGEMARLVRGLVWSLRNREFVLAARAGGATETAILFRHILPNIVQPVMVQTALMLPAFLLAEVAMSFLGVGLQEPEPSLGNMLASAADLVQIQQRPAGLVAPVAIIMLFLIATRLIRRSTSIPTRG